MGKPRQEKSTLHDRNKHRSSYDFKALIAACAELANFVAPNSYGTESIDFADPRAVKALNKALLKHFYQIDFWDIPEGYLCPPIPGRADYIHYVADLLATGRQQAIPMGKAVKVLDIGVGANCVYPLIGHREYGWRFVGTDIDAMAIRWARNIVNANNGLAKAIEIRQQHDKQAIFKHVIHKGERFDLTICNPPFHVSAAAAQAGSQRKVRNLGQKGMAKPVLNFGGQHHELWTAGGELAFIGKMIAESKLFATQCCWFTSLVAKSDHLPAIYAMLKKADVAEVKTYNMSTGNKITRIVAWTYLNQSEQFVRK